MTASLYQRLSSCRAKRCVSGWVFGSMRKSRIDSAYRPHAKEMRRHNRWIQLHEISRAMPDISRVGQQIMDLVGFLRADVKRVGRYVHPARLSMVRIEVYHHEKHI